MMSTTSGTTGRFQILARKYRLSEYAITLVMFSLGTLLHLSKAVTRKLSCSLEGNVH